MATLRMRLWVATSLCGVPWLVAACQIVAGLDDPLPAGPSGDASVGGSLDGAAADAALDGSADSMGMPGDGEAGATDGPRDASQDATWCQGNAPDAFFCCDFDEETQLANDWFQEKDPAGTTLDTNHYESPFQSLRAAPPSAVADGGVYEAYVQPLPFTEAATALHFGFHLLVGDVPDGSSYVTVAQLGLLPAANMPPTRTLSLLVYNHGAILQELVYLADGGRPSQAWSTLPLPTGAGAWSRVELDVVLDSDAGTGTCAMLIDSNQALSPQTLTPGWTTEIPAIGAGLIYSSGPLPDASVNIDNITLYIH